MQKIRLRIEKLSNIPRLSFLAVLAIIIVVSIALWEIFFKTTIKTASTLSGTEEQNTHTTASSPSADSDIQTQPQFGYNKTTLYKIKLSSKPTFTEPKEFLQDTIERILGIPITQTQDASEKTPLKLIAYDVRETDPYRAVSLPNGVPTKYVSSYYILVEGYKIDTSRVYEDDNLIIQIQSADQTITPYILDSDYCRVDDDCIVRHSFCGYGSFNHYDTFIDGPWGCGPPVDIETKDKNGNGYTFWIYDENMGCETNVKYNGSRCVNNRCFGQNRTVSCVN